MPQENALFRQWKQFNRLPFGRSLFDLFIKFYIPYTGSMSAGVQELRPGYARVTLRDRRKVRNHLRSIHAIALANLIEYTGNLAAVCGLPDDARFIVKGISVEYLKKARGTLTCECTTEIITSAEKREIPVLVQIKDAQDDIVATGKILTLVGPKK